MSMEKTKANQIDVKEINILEKKTIFEEETMKIVISGKVDKKLSILSNEKGLVKENE